jgi:hypothetical protein
MSPRSLPKAPDGVALMAQVSSTTVVVVEYPRGEFSGELARLLADSTITKVFIRLSMTPARVIYLWALQPTHVT